MTMTNPFKRKQHLTDAEGGGCVDEADVVYVSPIDILPHTLDDKQAKELREAVYDWYGF